MLQIVNGKRKAYALKSKHCVQRSHGSVFITCHFVYNNVSSIYIAKNSVYGVFLISFELLLGH